MANPGKILEKQWRVSAENQHLFILRLKDTNISFDKTLQYQSGSRFTTDNPCDYIQFYKGILLPLELKSTASKSISFEREEGKNGLIKKHQINSLIKFSQFDGVCPGLILEFRTEDENKNQIDNDCYFIHINDFSQFMCDSDKSSINKLDLVNYNAIIIESKKLRKYFTYNVKGLFEKIVNKEWLNL